MDLWTARSVYLAYVKLEVGQLGYLPSNHGQCPYPLLTERMVAATAAWARDRNNRGTKVNRQFSTDDARMKLRRLYPTF
jgi:predicted AAA+ superfamily ATPase